MSLFKKKPPRAGLVPAPQITLVTDPQRGLTMALGLSWRAIISTGQNPGVALAKQAKASHYALARAVVGVGRVADPKRFNALLKSGQLAGEGIYCAALMAGQAHKSNGIYALSVPGGREVWLCVLRQGEPSGQEEIASDSAAAAERLRLLASQNERFTVYTDLEGTGVTESVQTYRFADLLVLPPQSRARLVAVPTASLVGSIPKPVLVATALALTGLVAQRAWQEWQDWDKQQKRLLADASRTSEDAGQLWRLALQMELATRAAPSNTSWQALQASVGKLPAHWLGWQLKTVQCTSTLSAAAAGAAPTPIKLWACTASYGAPELAALAKSAASGMGTSMGTNQDLKASALPGYELEYLPTRAVNLRWTLKVTVATPDGAKLPERQTHLVETASVLQGAMATLSQAPEMRFTPLALGQPPKRASDGTAVPMPAGFKWPAESVLNLKAPLRSIEQLLGSRGLVADWRSVTVSYTPLGDSVVSPKTSAVMVDLMGALYAAQ